MNQIAAGAAQGGNVAYANALIPQPKDHANLNLIVAAAAQGGQIVHVEQLRNRAEAVKRQLSIAPLSAAKPQHQQTIFCAGNAAPAPLSVAKPQQQQTISCAGNAAPAPIGGLSVKESSTPNKRTTLQNETDLSQKQHQEKDELIKQQQQQIIQLQQQIIQMQQQMLQRQALPISGLAISPQFANAAAMAPGLSLSVAMPQPTISPRGDLHSLVNAAQGLGASFPLEIEEHNREGVAATTGEQIGDGIRIKLEPSDDDLQSQELPYKKRK